MRNEVHNEIVNQEIRFWLAACGASIDASPGSQYLKIIPYPYR
jgi:hypothetical protein